MTVENKRVYEVAKELGISNKEVIDCLEQKVGVKVKSHSSTLTASQVSRLKDALKTSKDPVGDKKPKAFIVKKSKPAPQAPDSIVDAEEVTSTTEDVATTNSKNAEETKVSEDKTQKPSDMRSLLEYNNRNSQKRREAELQAIKARRQEREKNEAQLQSRPRSQAPQQQQPKPRPIDQQMQRPNSQHQDRRNVITPRGPQRPVQNQPRVDGKPQPPRDADIQKLPGRKKL